MKVFVFGATYGEYEGNKYGRIHTLEPVTSGKGVGRQCAALKTTYDIARSIDEVDCEYDLGFDRYGKVVDAVKI